jgi:tRNA-dihydrouridine synthase
MVFQIFGNDAEKILKAAKIGEENGLDIIDIKIGC